MTATDATGNNKSGPEKKPGADHAEGNKPAANAAAAAKKLHDDSHPPVPKATSKPDGPKTADAPKSTDVGSSHGLLGWFADKEKAASDAVKSIVVTAKNEVKVVAAAASSAAGGAEKTLEHFGTLTLYSKNDEPKHDKAAEPKPAVKSAESVKKGDGANPLKLADSQADTPNGAGPGKVLSGGISTTDATPKAPSASVLGTITSVLGTIENTALAAAGEAGTAAKSALDAMMSEETQTALVGAAATLGTAAMGTGVLPTLIGYAGAAVAGYDQIFGSGAVDFKQTAEQVEDIDKFNTSKIHFGGENSARKNALLAAEIGKSAGLDWVIAGPGNAGGGAEISKSGNKVEAHGVSSDNTSVEAGVTPGESHAKAGTTEVTRTEQGMIVAAAKTVITYSKDLKTEYIAVPEQHVTLIWDKAKGTLSAVDDITHQQQPIPMISSNGVAVALSKTASLKLTTANGFEGEGKNPLANNIQTQYVQDVNGNKMAICSDGTIYKFYPKTHEEQVIKDGYMIKVDVTNGKVHFFQKGAKEGEWVPKAGNQSDMPKGWRLQPDGSIEINGAKMNGVRQKFLKFADGMINMATSDLQLKEGVAPMTVHSDGTTVKAVTAGVSEVDLHADGKGQISATGVPAVGFDIATQAYDIKLQGGSDIKLAHDGSTHIVDGSNGQVTDIDTHNNVKTYSANKQLLFSMNNQGDIHLYDGTNISHTGAVQNISRSIDEPSFNGKTADQVVMEAATAAASLSSYVGGAVDASIASLEAILATLDSLGDVPGLAEQIGTAKGNIEAKIAQARDKEFLNDQLAQAGKNNSTIEKALAMRGSGISDGEIAQRILQPQVA